MVFIRITFTLLKKMGSFHFVLVRIVVGYENLLSLRLVVIHFDFVQIFQYLFYFFVVFGPFT